MTYLYLDTETVGLSLMDHDVWEIGWAFDDEPVQSGFVPHSIDKYDSQAMVVNKYWSRCPVEDPREIDPHVEHALMDALNWHKGRGRPVTVVGSNPSFDTYRLSLRWGWKELWHHRLIDVSVYAMPLFGLAVPPGLSAVRDILNERDHDIPAPNHSAGGDVECTRAVFKALQGEYEQLKVPF